MKIKTSELTGRQLDFAVAKCEGWGPAYTFGNYVEGFFVKRAEPVTKLEKLNYSANWSLAGSIIEREKINTVYHPDINCMTGDVFPCWIASIVSHGAEGPTPLIAAMRCYVGSKLGDTVDIPDELL